MAVSYKQDSAKARITAEDLRQTLSEDGDLLKTIIEQTVQQVLEAEMEAALQAGKGERSENRLGYRSGYYGRTLITRVGKIELRVPPDRQRRFRTEVFEGYQRSGPIKLVRKSCELWKAASSRFRPPKWSG